jgi:bisphosphoglycerate-dependent phosphoglycerate mutase
MNRASSWKRVQGIARRHWGRLTGARLDRTAAKASREQVVEWLAREHKRDPIHQ